MGSMLDQMEDNEILEKTQAVIPIAPTRVSVSISVGKDSKDGKESESLLVTRMSSPNSVNSRSHAGGGELTKAGTPKIKEDSDMVSLFCLLIFFLRFSAIFMICLQSLYKVTNPSPSSYQIAGADNQPSEPLYTPDKKRRQEMNSQVDKDDSLLVADTTMLSLAFPFRRENDKYFDDRPRTPSSPFDSKKDRLRPSYSL